ncbi:hypothetical protein [Trujillonella humicola]|uniref:hypothetical protein n=1 Tax=Trujillonella humicola TaxID=3383699 RepID=UPI003906026A
MNAPHALATRPPSRSGTDEQTGLTALLDMFSAEEVPAGTPSPGQRPRPTLRASAPRLGARLLAWTRASSQRAAAWGAGPQGAWRAW